MSFVETEEQQALRKAVAGMAANYGQDYYLEKARSGERPTELWSEAGKLGFIGVNLPEEYGGGGAGMYELSLVMEEMSAAACPLLLMVVCPRDQRHDHRQVRHRGPEEALGCRPSPTVRPRWCSRSPNPTPGPTVTASPPPPAAMAATGSCQGRRCSSPGIDQAQAVLIVGPHLRTTRPATSSPRCCRRPHRYARPVLDEDRHGTGHAGRSCRSRCSSTRCACPPTHWSARRTPRSRNCSPA